MAEEKNISRPQDPESPVPAEEQINPDGTRSSRFPTYLCHICGISLPSQEILLRHLQYVHHKKTKE